MDDGNVAGRTMDVMWTDIGVQPGDGEQPDTEVRPGNGVQPDTEVSPGDGVRPDTEVSPGDGEQPDTEVQPDSSGARIVITGATGFIGSNLARYFLERGAIVYALVRPGSKNRAALLVHENLKVVDCGLEHVEDCIPAIGHADAFFHLAWGGVNREEIDSPEVQARNVSGSLECVRTAARLGCGMFMDAGSRVEYGAVDGVMREDVECHPINQYGRAKWEFYQKAAPLCRKLGLNYFHLRFFSVYGYGDHPWSIISTLVRDLRQDKKVSLSACLHQWNFMYIEDAVQAVYELYRHGRPEGEPCSYIVNIAGSDIRPLRSFVEEIHEIVGYRGELEYGTFVQAKEGALSIRPDISRLCRLTRGDWKEQYTFRQGIEETIEKEEA
uniref:NAD-dependent epimerase/dehydratase family protein n=1 Tax=Enterocloster aldenensis TaxID=358742 RepID=UPI001F1623DA